MADALTKKGARCVDRILFEIMIHEDVPGMLDAREYRRSRIFQGVVLTSLPRPAFAPLCQTSAIHVGHTFSFFSFHTLRISSRSRRAA